MSETNNTSQGASEYRGTSKCDTLNPIVRTDEKSNSQTKKMSFSGIVKASAFPKKDQAIILPVIENLQVKDYVIATGNIIDPKEILFASRMSNNRVCIYLSSKTMVNDFIGKHGGVQINDVFVPARKLILPAQRLILSNVSPCIPHSVIEEELKGIGVKLVSPMSFIGAGIGLDKFRHVCSFRRQIFVATEQSVEIPGTILVSFEDEEYRIFLSDDKLRCFKCKEEGHIASNCTTSVIDTAIPSISNKRPPPSTTNTSETDSLQANASCLSEMDTNLIDFPETQTQVAEVQVTKIPVDNSAPTPTVTDNSVIANDIVPDNTGSATKKRKIELETKSIEPYEEIEKIWQDNSSQPLDYINFCEFLKQVKGNNKPLEVARLYTDDIDGLINILKIAQLSISARSTRERCKRLIVSLKKAIIAEGKPVSSPPPSRSSSISSLNRSFSQDSVAGNASN